MQIRSAILSDAPRMAALIQTHRCLLTIDPGGAGADEYFTSVSAEAIAGYISSPDFRYVLSEEGESLLGFVALRDNKHLYHLFVATCAQNKGVGRMLWEHAKLVALSNGNPGDFTVNSSPSAQSVYEKFGFSQVAPRTEKHGVAFIPMRLILHEKGG